MENRGVNPWSVKKEKTDWSLDNSRAATLSTECSETAR